ncbi:exosortase/archaeosortase family protein [Marinimicrobium sp. ARAG 43.8]|uniref:exosortase/archaeosortase family protein n=1 Tax=Marinimicrobium sp. ARAG 43.8 TaxID=3418719 RepID=UPI003CEED7F6
MDIESSKRHSLPRPLSRFLPIFIACVWIGLFAFTFSDLWDRWIRWSSELAHGIPVIAIFLVLLWRTGGWERDTWINPSVETVFSTLALVASSLLWFSAYAVNIQLIEQLSLLLVLVSVYALIFGWKTIFRYRFLLLFPVFAIPVWGSLNDLLLEGASAVVGELVRLVEMPALIQGNSIFIPYGHIVIADGCSGLRYFVVALTIAFLIGYLNGYRETKLILTLLVAAVLGLVTNWIRIFILIVIGYNTQMQSSLMNDHETFGWILFGLIILPAIYFAPVRRTPVRSSEEGIQSPRISGQRVSASVLLMAIGPLLALVLHWAFDETLAAPERVGSGQLRAMPLPVSAPQGGTVSVERLSNNVIYRTDVYHRRGLQQKLVPYIPRLYDHQDWLLETERLETVGSHTLVLQLFSEKSGRDHVAQLQWFNVGGHLTDSRVKAKLLQLPATLKNQNQFSINTLQVRCDSVNCEHARGYLMKAAATLLNP